VTSLAWECPRAESSRRTVKQARRLVTRVPCAFSHASGERPRALCGCGWVGVCVCGVCHVDHAGPPPRRVARPSNRAKYERRCVKCAGSERIVAPSGRVCARNVTWRGTMLRPLVMLLFSLALPADGFFNLFLSQAEVRKLMGKNSLLIRPMRARVSCAREFIKIRASAGTEARFAYVIMQLLHGAWLLVNIPRRRRSNTRDSHRFDGHASRYRASDPLVQSSCDCTQSPAPLSSLAVDVNEC